MPPPKPAEIIPVIPGIVVKYKDAFHLANLYKLLRDWFNEHKYFDEFGGERYWEKFYLEKLDQAGREIWWWWRATKVPHGSSYCRFKFNLDSHCLFVRDQEIMNEGKKYKVNWGEIELTFTAVIELDYKGEWQKSGILRHFDNLFRKRIYHKDVEMHKKELAEEIYELQGLVKNYLELKGFLKPFEEFQPKKGVW